MLALPWYGGASLTLALKVPCFQNSNLRVRSATFTFKRNLTFEACTPPLHRVESSPLRTAEVMSKATADRLVELLDASPGIKTLDITGGAPEMHEQFRPLVRAARERGLDIIDRCNLTVGWCRLTSG